MYPILEAKGNPLIFPGPTKQWHACIPQHSPLLSLLEGFHGRGAGRVSPAVGRGCMNDPCCIIRAGW